MAASFQLCAMRDTNPSLLDSVGTPLVAASFSLGAMCDANSSLLAYEVHPARMTAMRHMLLCAMSDTNPSLLGLLVTSLEAATLSNLNCSMCDTNSPPHYLVGTPLKATSLDFPLSAMRPTHSPPNGSVGTCSILPVES